MLFENSTFGVSLTAVLSFFLYVGNCAEVCLLYATDLVKVKIPTYPHYEGRAMT